MTDLEMTNEQIAEALALALLPTVIELLGLDEEAATGAV